MLSLFLAPLCSAADSFSLDKLSTSPVERIYNGTPGPWGDLQYTRIAVGIPDEYLETVTTGTFDMETWVFMGHSRRQVAEIFAQADLDPEQREYIMRLARWEEGPGATVVFPSSEFILGMSTAARTLIYEILARFPENPAHAGAYMFRPHFLNDHFYKSGVTTQTIERFHKLLYPRGNLLKFADLDPFLSSLPTAEEKRRFHLAISRRMTLLVKLDLNSNSDIEELLEYWDASSRPKELRPLFESLARLDVEGLIDLAHVMPGFARKRIYTFPRPNDINPVDHNCHWSAFNFFNDPPDERFCQRSFIQDSVLKNYQKIESEPRFGDILVMLDRHGSAVHSVVWIADGVVFTKNGSGHTEPWLYMHFRDVVDFYSAAAPPGETYQIEIHRRKQTTN